MQSHGAVVNVSGFWAGDLGLVFGRNILEILKVIDKKMLAFHKYQ